MPVTENILLPPPTSSKRLRSLDTFRGRVAASVHGSNTRSYPAPIGLHCSIMSNEAFYLLPQYFVGHYGVCELRRWAVLVLQTPKLEW